MISGSCTQMPSSENILTCPAPAAINPISVSWAPASPTSAAGGGDSGIGRIGRPGHYGFGVGKDEPLLTYSEPISKRPLGRLRQVAGSLSGTIRASTRIIATFIRVAMQRVPAAQLSMRERDA